MVSAAVAAALSTQLGRKSVYYIGSEGTGAAIWRLDLDTLKVNRIYGSDVAGFRPEDISPSPDGRQLAIWVDVIPPGANYSASSEITLMYTDGSHVRTLTEAPGPLEAVGSPEWSPKGALLAYAHEHFNNTGPEFLDAVDLHVFDPSDGADRVVVSQDRLESFAWSPDDAQFGLGEASTRPALSVLNLSTHQQRVLWGGPALVFQEQAWQPGGDQIAVTVRTEVPVGSPDSPDNQDGLYLVSVITGQHRELVAGSVGGIHWSPDGKLLFYCGLGPPSRPRLFDVARGTSAILLDQNIDCPGSSPWSPRGDALLLALEQKPPLRYSISVLTLQDRKVLSLASVDWPYPDLTW
jgi:WD40 repeat protein